MMTTQTQTLRILSKTLRINIIGYGVVGKAQGACMTKLGNSVYPYDPYCYPDKQLCKDADLTFVCAPEKTVDSIVEQFVKQQIKGLLVIKSTVPIGTTKRLMQQYGIHICHNPEFLREKLSVEDTLNPSRIVIGACCQEHARLLTELYKPLNAPIHISDPTTSETAKLVANCIRAVNISFWNELNQLCNATGADIYQVSKISDPAKVLGEYEGGQWGTRFFGKHYDGKCLPKDMQQLIDVFRSNGLNSALLEASEKINNNIKKASE